MSLKEIKARKEPSGHLDLIIDAQAPAPANTISFYADGKVVGSLDLGVDPITFTGNADEAAIVFFDSFIRLYDQRYKELQEQVAELAKDRAFFRSCALSGEIPECGSEPSALEQKT